MISTANQVAYAMGITDDQNLYSCNTIGAKTSLVIGAAQDAESDDDADVFSDGGEEFPPSGNTFFGNYDDDGSGSYSSDSDSDDGSSKRSKAPLAAPAVPLVASAEATKLAKIHAALRSDEKYSKELLFHEKVICKACGKERVALQAFDNHVCEPSSAVPKAASSAAPQKEKSGFQLTMADFAARDAAANPKLENSPMWHAAMKEIAEGAPMKMFEDGEPLDDLHQYLIQSNAAMRKLEATEKATFARAAASNEDAATIGQDNVNLRQWLREVKGIKDVENYKPSPRDYVESTEYVNSMGTKTNGNHTAEEKANLRVWLREVKGVTDFENYKPSPQDYAESKKYAKARRGPLKVVNTMNEDALIEAVVTGEDYKSAFNGANGAVVMVRGKFSPKQQAYYVKMGFASNSSSDADAKKMHKVIKFTTAGEADPTLSHKLLASGVDGLHKQFDKSTVAANVETVLNVAKKITDKRNA